MTDWSAKLAMVLPTANCWLSTNRMRRKAANSQNEAQRMACTGVITLVAMMVEMELAASFMPFRKVKTKARTMERMMAMVRKFITILLLKDF